MLEKDYEEVGADTAPAEGEDEGEYWNSPRILLIYNRCMWLIWCFEMFQEKSGIWK